MGFYPLEGNHEVYQREEPVTGLRQVHNIAMTTCCYILYFLYDCNEILK
jgi:hypothetical protein